MRNRVPPTLRSRGGPRAQRDGHPLYEGERARPWLIGKNPSHKLVAVFARSARPKET